jgi:hypothetical protein
LGVNRMIRERVRAVLGRVPEPAKAWLRGHREIAERSIARVKRKETVLREKLQGLRHRAEELREWARGAKAAPAASAPTPASDPSRAVSE